MDYESCDPDKGFSFGDKEDSGFINNLQSIANMFTVGTYEHMPETIDQNA